MQHKFRQSRGGMEAWHFMEDCAEWPAGDFAERLDTPPISEVCEKCIELSALMFSDAEIPQQRERTRRARP